MNGKIHIVSRRKGAAPYPSGLVIYCGDRVRFHVETASPLANKFRGRETAIADYDSWLNEQYRQPGPVRSEIHRIAGLVSDGTDVCLECWCHPNPCHTHSIRDLILRITAEWFCRECEWCGSDPAGEGEARYCPVCWGPVLACEDLAERAAIIEHDSSEGRQRAEYLAVASALMFAAGNRTLPAKSEITAALDRWRSMRTAA